MYCFVLLIFTITAHSRETHCRSMLLHVLSLNGWLTWIQAFISIVACYDKSKLYVCVFWYRFTRAKSIHIRPCNHPSSVGHFHIKAIGSVRSTKMQHQNHAQGNPLRQKPNVSDVILWPVRPVRYWRPMPNIKRLLSHKAVWLDVRM